MSHRAVDVMYAVYGIFAKRGDESYACNKTNSFLRRVGADINKPNGELDSDVVEMTANAMLDKDAEEEFFSALYKEEA